MQLEEVVLYPGSIVWNAETEKAYQLVDALFTVTHMNVK